MLVSPFTFYRGAAAVMAHDLASTPRAGLRVQAVRRRPPLERRRLRLARATLVFDLNDFDETLPGPFEWDLKRLAASFEIAGRDRDFTKAERTKAVLTAVGSYREWMRKLAEARNLDVWYASLDVEAIERNLHDQQAKHQAAVVAKAAEKARTKDSLKAFAKLTHLVDGEPRIVSDPPLIVPPRTWPRRRASRSSGSRAHPPAVPGVPPHAAAGPPAPARGVPDGRPRPQGRRRRQRGHALLDPPAARP
jgi:hypothetical protein